MGTPHPPATSRMLPRDAGAPWRRRVRLSFLLAALVPLASCASLGSGEAAADSDPRGGYSLCVNNTGIYDFRVYANEYRLGLITSGDSKVFRVPAALRYRPITFTAEAVDTGRDVQLRMDQMGAHQAWKWTLSNSPVAGRAQFRMTRSGCSD